MSCSWWDGGEVGAADGSRVLGCHRGAQGHALPFLVCIPAKIRVLELKRNPKVAGKRSVK